MPKTSPSKLTTRKQPYRKARLKDTNTQLTTAMTTTELAVSSPQLSSTPDWRAEKETNTDAPIFFWKPNEAWGFLGQWYTSPFYDPMTKKTFTCCEQYMMYRKAVTFDDTASAAKIMVTDNPRTHKALGKKVSGFNSHVWDQVKFDIVVDANLLKFGKAAGCVAQANDVFVYPPHGQVKVGRQLKDGVGRNVTLYELLESTGDRELVEASSRDKIWGIGFSPEKAPAVQRVKWGKNLLGKALMEVRRRLREE